MGIIALLFGGAVGFALAGPLGALAGAAIGHGLGQQGLRARTLADHEQAQAAFFIATFSLLAKMARADGRVSREEIDLVQRFMRDELGLDREAERYAVRIFRAAKDSPVPFEEFAGQFRQLFEHEPQMRAAMVDLLVRMALADGTIDGQEREMLRSAARILEVELSGFEHLVGQHEEDFERHYHTLGLDPGADFAAVRARHRQLVTEVHPDKIIAKGLPEEFVRYAEKRFREIQEAYEAIRDREQATS